MTEQHLDDLFSGSNTSAGGVDNSYVLLGGSVDMTMYNEYVAHQQSYRQRRKAWNKYERFLYRLWNVWSYLLGNDE